VELAAIPDKEDLAIARVIVEKIYCRHGTPGTIITDHGKEFVNKLLPQACILLYIGSGSTSGYNPRLNGLVEQHNSTSKAMFAAYARKHQDDWDLHLPQEQYAYMTTICSATGMTLFCILHGREARWLCYEWSQQYFKEASKPKAYVLITMAVSRTKEAHTTRRIDRISQRIPSVISILLENTHTYTGIKAKSKSTDDPTALSTDDKTTKGKSEGKPKSQAVSNAQQHRWTGPYKVTAKFSPILYETIINREPHVVHALHMKHDPISDTLKLKQLLPISETMLMRSFLDKKHTSLQPKKTTGESKENVSSRPAGEELDSITNEDDEDSENEDEENSEHEYEDDKEDDY